MIVVFPVSATEMYVEWRGFEGDEYRVLRSTTETGRYEPVVDHLPHPFFFDRNLSLYDNAVNFYYKIEAYSNGKKTGEQIGTHEYTSMDGVALKLMQEFRVVLRAMRTPPMFVLTKRSEGQRCPECWNPVTRRAKFADCKKCNGTTYMGGYYDPYPIRVSRDISALSDETSVLDGDNIHLSPVRAWTERFPLIKPGDVLVDVQDMRFIVTDVQHRTRSQYIVRQEMQLTPLEKGHPAHLVQVDRKRYYEGFE